MITKSTRLHPSFRLAAVPSLKMATLSTCTGVERPVYWQDGKLFLIDQKILPGEFKIISVASMAETIAAIKDMTVRGAPAIGAAGAFGLALEAAATKAASV